MGENQPEIKSQLKEQKSRLHLDIQNTVLDMQLTWVMVKDQKRIFQWNSKPRERSHGCNAMQRDITSLSLSLETTSKAGLTSLGTGGLKVLRML